ncbi:chromosome segregation protein SMC [Bifidobacterium favimelis]|uniref:Chromosome partition protein Smc n=1 Tax=Bifidobacterium favimelis TaxID=3122979 RepID=A0ABU8ZNN1_9BIFI
MYLKELTLRGFKSFASATTLRFEPGITAVVGPNGSGKSNIVDALAWVMGEQGAKSLRGSSMEDVIFAGTSSKPPLGRAQVSLTIDNSDHTLDIDYAEVTISRTIYRNGGSEYAINGSSCRLLDIQELLSDTGLGQQMHVIVGQGRLDAILRADPSGHRAFIEEAAGILKHRKRKERALRKLANTQTNLSRLDDLIGEIHRQLGPLGRQAKVSRRADMIQVSLRDAQARIYAEDALNSRTRLGQVRREMASTRSRLEAGQRDLARIRMQIEQIEGRNRQSSPQLESINQVWHDLTRLQERFRSLSSLAGERSRSLMGQVDRNPGEDPDILEARAAELDGQAKEKETDVSRARLDLDRAVEARADAERQLAGIRQTLTELRTAARRRDTEMGSLREMMAREESARQLAVSRQEDLKGQIGTTREQLEQVRRQVDGLTLEDQSDQADGGDELQQATQAGSEAGQALEALRDRQRVMQAQAVSLKAKADALDDTLSNRGLDQGQDGRNLPVLGRLSDYIQVEEGWEEALALALRDYDGALVVDGPDSLFEALAQVRRDHLGRSAFLLADRGTSRADPATAARGGGAAPSGPAIPAAGLVRLREGAADGKHAAAVLDTLRLLLAGTAAVEDGQEALKALSAGWDQAVTRQGDLFDRGGGIGGSGAATSDLALTAKRDRALEEAGSLKEQMDRLAVQIGQAEQVQAQASQRLDQARARQTEARVRAEQRGAAISQARRQAATLESRIKELQEKAERTAEDERMHQIKYDDLKSGLDKAGEEGSDQVDFDDMDRREHELESSLDQGRAREMEAKMAWQEATRKAQSLSRQAGLLHDQAAQAAEHRKKVAVRNQERRHQAAVLSDLAARAGRMSDLAGQALTSADRERSRLKEEASAQDEELAGLRKERDGLEPSVGALRDREHELDVTRERLATQDGQLQQRIHDELGMETDGLIRDYGPDRPVPVLDEEGNPVPLEDPQAGQAQAQGDDTRAEGRYRTVPYVRDEQAKRLEKAKRDLAALGKVNPLATEEYEALQARNSYLNDQKADVVKTRDDLMGLVKDLDATMVQVFKSAFDDTAAAFERMFSTLFPGGSGRLRLENPDDLLTTGVIVEASPAGKKVRQLSLLSGGERSLTALALLFAIFTARPSPFYVMDEVEAALDDVNLTRLIRAFNQLREHAQLIIITHQQRTMGIADALYGITMRGDGVSAVISQKLDRGPDSDLGR